MGRHFLWDACHAWFLKRPPFSPCVPPFCFIAMSSEDELGQCPDPSAMDIDLASERSENDDCDEQLPTKKCKRQVAKYKNSRRGCTMTPSREVRGLAS